MVTLSEIPTNLVPLNQLFWLSMNVYLVTLNTTSTSNKLLEAQVTNFGGFCVEALSITDNNLFLIKGQKVNKWKHP